MKIKYCSHFISEHTQKKHYAVRIYFWAISIQPTGCIKNQIHHNLQSKRIAKIIIYTAFRNV